MARTTHEAVTAREIARFLNSELIGEDMVISSPAALDRVRPGTVTFIKNKNVSGERDIPCLFIVPEKSEIREGESAAYIKVKNPRLAFAKTVAKFFVEKPSRGISDKASIDPGAQLAPGVSVGDYCVIEENVKIGPGTSLDHHVVIRAGTVIGKNCRIGSGTAIGHEGFGFDFEEDGTPVRLPHIGGVVIGDEVEIGAGCTIARGTLSDTVIGNRVKIDDQVHIAHNCEIGEKSVITACAELSGSVKVGERCWIGPNASIIQKISIGERALIGLGAVVTKDVEAGRKVMGLAAMELRDLIKIKKMTGR